MSLLYVGDVLAHRRHGEETKIHFQCTAESHRYRVSWLRETLHSETRDPVEHVFHCLTVGSGASR